MDRNKEEVGHVMMYAVYFQHSRPTPMLDKPWRFLCRTESDLDPADYDWNSIIKPLTGESAARNSDKGNWFFVVPDDRTPNYYIDENGDTHGRP